MATRKKAKGKTKARGKTKTKAKRKTKARKAPARKLSARKKAAKKTSVRRAPSKAKKPAARRAAAKTVAAGPVVKPPPGKRIGVVTHYFSHLSVAVVKLETGTLRVGDSIHFRGHTTDFGQRVESLQLNHAPVTEVGPRDDFGLKVREHTRENDIVYKVA